MSICWNGLFSLKICFLTFIKKRVEGVCSSVYQSYIEMFLLFHNV